MRNAGRQTEPVVCRRRGLCRGPAIRAGLAGVLLGLIAAVALVSRPASAEAATGHKFVQSLSQAPPGTTLGEPAAVAVEQSSGRVFLADPGRGMVDVFGSSGGFEAQFGEGALGGSTGLAVDEATHDVYVAEPFEDAVDVFKPDGQNGYQLVSQWSGVGTPEREFGEVAGVAVDNSQSASDPHAGDVYVLDASKDAVDVFKPAPAGAEEAREGAFVSALSGGALEEPNGVAVDSATGKVYVADSVLGAIDVYGAAGAFEKKLNGAGSPAGTFAGPEEEEGNVAGVSVDQATGQIYVAEAQRRVLTQFDSEGKWIGQILSTPDGPLGEPRAVAIGPTGGVYLADASAHLVDVFGADVIVPDAKTTAASKVGKISAILDGLVNGDGKLASYRFQWGESEALGSETEAQSTGASEEKASAELVGLKPGTTYFFRLVAENENGASYGAIREFTTAPPVEGLSTGPAQAIKPTEATLTGTLKPDGIDAHYFFRWGRTSAYGSTSPEHPADAGSSKESVEAKVELTGLSPNTAYHYQLVGENELGLTEGEDAKFTTSGPPRIASEATSVEGHEAATIRARVDPDKLETKYHFEYGESTAYGREVPLGGGTIPAGEVAVAESASLSELKIGTTYHFRVVASNEAGTTVGPDQIFTTIAAAPIDATFATNVGADEATLHTQINPLGHDTIYYFQYGVESCVEHPDACTNIPSAPGEDIGAGSEDVAKSIQLSGLKPQTTYYYRVLATNSLGISAGPQRPFTTQAQPSSLTLPDGRTWEMVSPPNKRGVPVEALSREGGLILAAEDGDALTYVVDGALEKEAQGNRSPEMQQVLATRTPEGWSSQDIVTPNGKAYGVGPGAAPEYQFFSPGLSLALVEPFGPEPPLSPEASQKTIYVRDNENGSYLPLVTEANIPAGSHFGGQIHFVNATPDLSHVLIQSAVALSQSPAGPGLYEWSAGKLSFVSVLPGGAAAPASSLGFGNHVISHAISNDGSRVIWENRAEGTSQGHLYMRQTSRGETIQLDAAQGAPEAEEGSAQFQAASADGSRVFFTDTQRLTADSAAEPGKPDLYVCEAAELHGKLGCHLRDLTVASDGGPGAVQGLVLGASEQGRDTYLVAQGVLASNENGNGESAEAGRDNLYALTENGGAWTSTFVASLSSEDSPEWLGSKIADPAFVAARVSPNGRYFAFMSAAPITGYDNIDAHSARPDEEVYLYDAGTASLTCASCNPTGARPAGVLDRLESGEGLGLVVDRRKVWAESGHEHWLAGSIPGWTAQSFVAALFQPRYLSDEGRLFFNSPDDLVPAASNNKEDVYEYEPTGVGNCQSPSGACISLISSGTSTQESAFLEATSSGNDVYFLTAERLLPQDTDSAFDIYDARVCGEQSPCLHPAETPPSACGATATCRPAQAPEAIPGAAPATATFSGSASAVAPATLKGRSVKQAKPLSAAEKLTKALAACRKRYPHSKPRRRACEGHARKLYGTKHRPTSKHHKAKVGKSSSATAKERKR